MTLKEVRRFNEAFEISIPEGPINPPLTDHEFKGLSEASLALGSLGRYLHKAALEQPSSMPLIAAHLMVEELSELVEAMALRYLKGILHESVDLRVVVDGTILKYGLGSVFHPAFNRVDVANMSKLDDNGKPVKNAAGRIIKGPNFVPADLSDLVP